jgi:hypothetical protein
MPYRQCFVFHDIYPVEREDMMMMTTMMMMMMVAI